MNNTNTLDKSTVAFGISACIAIVFNSLLVILKEIFPTIHDMLTSLSGNHWVSHGILDVSIFVLFGFFFYKFTLSDKNIISVIVVSSFLSSMTIILYNI